MLLRPPKVSCTYFLLQETYQQGEPSGLLPAQSGGRDWGEVVDVRGTGPSIRLLHANLSEIGQQGVVVGGARALGGYVWKGRLRQGDLEGRVIFTFISLVSGLP